MKKILSVVFVLLLNLFVFGEDDDYYNLYGIMAQQEFEDGWNDALKNVYYDTDSFESEMNKDPNTRYKFYDEMRDKKYYWHDSSLSSRGKDHESPGLDTVDIFYTSTHSGAWNDPPLIAWTMWNKWAYARSKYMRLGDDGRKLSIFSSFTCDTMMLNSWEKFIGRWENIFKGGLRIATGFTGNSKDVKKKLGGMYAKGLISGKSIRNSWIDAMDYRGMPASVLVTGTDEENSKKRMRMTYQNYKKFSRIRDDKVVSWYLVERSSD